MRFMIIMVYCRKILYDLFLIIADCLENAHDLGSISFMMNNSALSISQQHKGEYYSKNLQMKIIFSRLANPSSVFAYLMFCFILRFQWEICPNDLYFFPMNLRKEINQIYWIINVLLLHYINHYEEEKNIIFIPVLM